MIVTKANIEEVTSSCHRVKVFSVNKTKPFTAKRLKQLEERGMDLLPITKPLRFRGIKEKGKGSTRVIHALGACLRNVYKP